MNIFCSGIGGIGVSAYASLQQANGHNVAGSDTQQTLLTKQLQAEGIQVVYTQVASNIHAGIDLLVCSEAVPATSAERTKATELGITQLSYFEALGALTANHFLIAVCGTHGKSSTTAMAAQVLTEAAVDPTVVVGTKVPFLQNHNWRQGKSNVALVEACEFARSFLHLRPNVVLLTNADGDHFDTYGSAEAYKQAFAEFLQLLPADGVIITHLEDPICKQLAEASGKKVINADLEPMVPLQVPGTHMQKNAQLVTALRHVLPAVNNESATNSLASHTGCWRRLELKGTTASGIPVIDDYGHHPVEIRANLAALTSKYPDKRLVVVFQPHTHQRTIDLYAEFTKCFTQAGLVVIPNIYDVRRAANTNTVDPQTFTNDIANNSNVSTYYTQSLQHTKEQLEQTLLQAGDVLVCMGAGDITSLATSMVA